MLLGLHRVALVAGARAPGRHPHRDPERRRGLQEAEKRVGGRIARRAPARELGVHRSKAGESRGQRGAIVEGRRVLTSSKIAQDLAPVAGIVGCAHAHAREAGEAIEVGDGQPIHLADDAERVAGGDDVEPPDAKGSLEGVSCVVEIGSCRGELVERELLGERDAAAMDEVLEGRGERGDRRSVASARSSAA